MDEKDHPDEFLTWEDLHGKYGQATYLMEYGYIFRVTDYLHPQINTFWRTRGDIDRAYFKAMAWKPKEHAVHLPRFLEEERVKLGSRYNQIDSPMD